MFSNNFELKKIRKLYCFYTKLTNPNIFDHNPANYEILQHYRIAYCHKYLAQCHKGRTPLTGGKESLFLVALTCQFAIPSNQRQLMLAILIARTAISVF